MFSWPKIDAQQIIELLKNVLDPITKKNLIDAGRIEGINIDKNRINVALNIPESQQDLYKQLQKTLTHQIQDLTKQPNVFVVMTTHTGDRSDPPMVASSTKIELQRVK